MNNARNLVLVSSALGVTAVVAGVALGLSIDAETKSNSALDQLQNLSLKNVGEISLVDDPDEFKLLGLYPGAGILLERIGNNIVITSTTVGEQGPSGRDGAQGFQGDTGEVGATGADGENGLAVEGPTGATGGQGVTGSNGEQGVSGSSGEQGISGASGQQGISGEQGVSGSSGQQGISGTSGEQGVTGSSGEQGVSGSSGQQGISGASGEQGVSGASGQQGVSGASGSVGATGLTGASGNQLAIFSQWTPVTVASTMVQTTLLTTGAGSLVVPATLILGSILRLTIAGFITALTGDNLQLTFSLAANGQAVMSYTFASDVTAVTFEMEFFLIVRTEGASGATRTAMAFIFSNNATSGFLNNIQIGLLDTTVTNTINVTALWSTTTGSVQAAIVEVQRQ